jgi:hypothetical protein
VNEKICEARPAAGGAAGEDPSGTGGEKDDMHPAGPVAG